MTELGLLYEKLIVDSRHSHATYHHYVQKVIEEMKKDLPIPCRTWEGMAYYHYSDTSEWLRKWLGDRAGEN